MNLEQLIDKIRATPEEDGRVALGDIMESLGTRSFGSFLVLAGLIVVMPLIGDIPGVPTLVGVIVALVSIQLLMGRKQFWLPQTMLKRSIEKARLDRALQRMERPVSWIDRMIKPRLSALVEGNASYFIAACSLLVAAMMPPMELVPFSANLAGLALITFGLALVARDGLFALLAFAFTLIGLALAASAIL